MFVTVAVAKERLRIDTAAEDAQIEAMLLTAELSAINFLNRNVYADQAALDAAIAAAPTALTAATLAHETAMAAAALMANEVERDIAEAVAEENYAAAQAAAKATYRGIVINEAIKSAILLITGHLYANREDVVVGTGAAAVQIPNGSNVLLQPYRYGMGV